MSKDLYSTLGISKGATQDEIKKAYRKLVIANHPDTKTDPKEKASAEKKLAEINEAYEILSDASKRKRYDATGSTDSSGHHSGFGGGGSGQFGGFDFSDIFEGFNDIFNQGGSARKKATREYQGSDLRYKLTISLKDAFYGIKDKVITFMADDKCKTCDGNGSKSGKAKSKCTKCNGTGALRMQQGFFIVEQTCNICQGEGAVIADPCGTCGGTGAHQQERKIRFDIPAGIENDSTIKIQKGGEVGKFNGQYGNMYVQVAILSDKTFKREGSDLIVDMPIKFTDAALGANLEIIGIDGQKINIVVPKGSQPRSKVVIKNAGMTILNKENKRGDLIAELHVEVPSKLNQEQESLLRQFSNLCSKGSHPKTESFFDSIKNLFS